MDASDIRKLGAKEIMSSWFHQIPLLPGHTAHTQYTCDQDIDYAARIKARQEDATTAYPTHIDKADNARRIEKEKILQKQIL